MDPHEGLFSPPPPAYSEQEYDRKISQATQLSEETAKWERPKLDVDEEGWPVYDPSLFEEKPKETQKVLATWKGSSSSYASSEMVKDYRYPSAAASGSTSKAQHQRQRSASPSLPKIGPLRITKKTKAQEAAEDAQNGSHQLNASGSSVRLDTGSTTPPQDGAYRLSVSPPLAEHFQPYVTSYTPPSVEPQTQHAAPSGPVQAAQPIPHETPFVPAYSSDDAESRRAEPEVHVAPQPESLLSPFDTPIAPVPTYTLEAHRDQTVLNPLINPYNQNGQAPSQQVQNDFLHGTPDVPTYSLEAPQDQRLAEGHSNRHDVNGQVPEPLQEAPIAPSYSLGTSHEVEALTSSFNQSMSLSTNPSLPPPQPNYQAQVPSYGFNRAEQPVSDHEARTPTPQAQILQPAAYRPQSNPRSQSPALSLQVGPEQRSWTPSLEPLDLPPSNGQQQQNSYMGSSSYGYQQSQRPISPLTPRQSMPAQPSAPRIAIPARPQSSVYSQPAPVPRLSFNPQAAYSGAPPAARFIPAQQAQSPATFDAGSFYNSAVSSQLRNMAPIKPGSFSTYQPQAPSPPQSYANPNPAMSVVRQPFAWQTPPRPVSVYSTMSNSSMEGNNMPQYNNQQYPTYTTTTVPNNWYPSR